MTFKLGLFINLFMSAVKKRQIVRLFYFVLALKQEVEREEREEGQQTLLLDQN